MTETVIEDCTKFHILSFGFSKIIAQNPRGGGIRYFLGKGKVNERPSINMLCVMGCAFQLVNIYCISGVEENETQYCFFKKVME